MFPLENLYLFSADELQLLLCGDQAPSWSRDDLLRHTEPKNGYTRDSPGYQMFLDVAAAMTPDERKNFIHFVTGSSSLPPGGLANLHPTLTVVRKHYENEHVLPSVNTCVHYLKIPEYHSKEILRERLLVACKEKGFHLN